MKLKVFFILSLAFCLIVAAVTPAVYAEEPPALGDFIDRYGPLLGDGLDALTDWLDGKAASLAPELRETLRDIDTEALFSDLTDLIGETRGMDADAGVVRNLQQGGRERPRRAALPRHRH